MKPTLFTIKRTNEGTLSTMARPRGGYWLDDEMQSLSNAGVTVVVSFLTQAEEAELELQRECEFAGAWGIQFIAISTPDRGLPDRAAFLGIIKTTRECLRQGRHVVSHCRMGVGRSSLLAAAVLIARESLQTKRGQRFRKNAG